MDAVNVLISLLQQQEGVGGYFNATVNSMSVYRQSSVESPDSADFLTNFVADH